MEKETREIIKELGVELKEERRVRKIKGGKGKKEKNGDSKAGK